MSDGAVSDVRAKAPYAERGWPLTAGLLFSAMLVVVAVYHQTAFSAVYLWTHHKTYGYAFAVLPIVAFLVWRERGYFDRVSPVPTAHAAAVALAFAAFWLAGARLGVLEMQHLALPGMLIALAIAAVGWRGAAHFWLPLAYLFLLAPAGTPLLPFLQDVTTVIATILLNIGQIAFYAEGYTIEVATGKYEIAPGCAGLNFILALATIAPLFSVLMYDSWRKRLIAVGLMMAFVPIANGFRVFAIIAIAEYTNRAIDITADHLLYGWLFFSLVVFVMFWIGSFFADPLPPAREDSAGASQAIGSDALLRQLAVALTIVMAICVAPSFLVGLG